MIAQLTAIADALEQIVTLVPQVQTALSNLSTFLSTL